MNWGRLEQKKKGKCLFFVEAMLRNEEFDIYMHHSLPYMEAVNKELKALEEIYVVKRKGSIVATVNVIREEKPAPDHGAGVQPPVWQGSTGGHSKAA